MDNNEDLSILSLNQDELDLYNILSQFINRSNINSIYNIHRYSNDGSFICSIKVKTKKQNMLEHLDKPNKIKNSSPLLDEYCSICFSLYKENEYQRILGNCGHYFHKKCIDKWFKKNEDSMNCPICRKNYNKVSVIQNV